MQNTWYCKPGTNSQVYHVLWYLRLRSTAAASTLYYYNRCNIVPSRVTYTYRSMEVVTAHDGVLQYYYYTVGSRKLFKNKYTKYNNNINIVRCSEKTVVGSFLFFYFSNRIIMIIMLCVRRSWYESDGQYET